MGTDNTCREVTSHRPEGARKHDVSVARTFFAITGRSGDLQMVHESMRQSNDFASHEQESNKRDDRLLTYGGPATDAEILRIFWAQHLRWLLPSQLLHVLIVACVAVSTIAIGDPPQQLSTSTLTTLAIASFNWREMHLMLWASLVISILGILATYRVRVSHGRDASLLLLYGLSGVVVLLLDVGALAILVNASPIRLEINRILISERQYLMSWDFASGVVLLAPALIALILSLICRFVIRRLKIEQGAEKGAEKVSG